MDSPPPTPNYLNNLRMYPAGALQGMPIKVSIDNRLPRSEVEIGDMDSRFDRIKSTLLVSDGGPSSLAARKSTIDQRGKSKQKLPARKMQ